MGSTGSGSLTDYSNNRTPADGNRGGSGGGGSGGAGGGGGGSPPSPDRCALTINASLEDVELSDYFKSNGNVPHVGTELKITHRKRLVAETTTGESVGNLPTAFNYLIGCMNEGWTYIGRVAGSSNGPPYGSVDADFAAVSP